MGYHRPVSSFNIGKKGEHAERRHFTESAAATASDTAIQVAAA
jgi:ribonucleoside-triphosphate reductase